MISKFLLAPFLLAMLLQMLVCLKIQKGLFKMLPLVIDLIALFYAGARFIGIISYPSDSLGIYDGGLVDGIFISAMSVASLVGIALAWLIYFIIG